MYVENDLLCRQPSKLKWAIDFTRTPSTRSGRYTNKRLALYATDSDRCRFFFYYWQPMHLVSI